MDPKCELLQNMQLTKTQLKKMNIKKTNETLSLSLSLFCFVFLDPIQRTAHQGAPS